MCIPLPVVDVRALPIALWSFQRPGPHRWWWGPWTLRSFFRPFSFLLPFSLVAFWFWFLILNCFVNYCCSSHLATCFLIFTCEVNGMWAVRAGILFRTHWNIRTFCIEINTLFGEGFFLFCKHDRRVSFPFSFWVLFVKAQRLPTSFMRLPHQRL